VICNTSPLPIVVGCRVAWSPSLRFEVASHRLRIYESSLVGKVVEVRGNRIVARDTRTGKLFSGGRNVMVRVCSLRVPREASDVSVLAHATAAEVVA